MASFIFQFEPVLEHRQRLEDQRQRELAQLLREKMIFERQLSELQEGITQDKRAMAGSLVGVVDVSRIRQHAVHNVQVTLRAQQIAVKLLGLHRQIDQSRIKLTESMRARKAIELLRDRQHRRWSIQQQRRETAELDEMATQRHGRRRQEAVR